MDYFFSQLSEAVPQARTLEQLTRPLLAMLGAATGLESTYFTTIDLAADVQHCAGQVLSDTAIGCLIADCCSKALGGKLPSLECSRTLL